MEYAYTDEQDSYPNNPNIAEGLYMAGDIETLGFGFDKIQRACSRYGTPLPKIKVTKESVRIYIDPAESSMKVLHQYNSVAENPTESPDYPADMKFRYKQILDAMLRDKEYSAEQIGEVISLKGSRTRKLMGKLVALGYVTITTGTKGRQYKKK